MRNKPQLVILGGINGAGKSSTRDRYLKRYDSGFDRQKQLNLDNNFSKE